MITYKIHIIRTASSQQGDNQGYISHIDLPLSENGVKHLSAMKESFDYPQVSAVYTSPLSRAVYTAQFLYPDTQIFPIDELIDLDLGEFSGKTYSQLEPLPEFQNWLKDSRNTPPGGESTEVFVQRITSGIEKIFREMMDNSITQVAVITHAGVIMSLLSSVGLPEMPIDNWFSDNATGFTIQITPQMWMRDRKVEIISRVPYLKETD